MDNKSFNADPSAPSNSNSSIPNNPNPSMPINQNASMPYNGAAIPTYAQRIQSMTAESTEVQDFREKMARKLGPASLIYGIFSTFCIYKNFTGVTMPFFGIATLIYMVYCLKQYDVKLKRTGWFYGAALIGFSISNFLTGSIFFHFFNMIGIMLMIFIYLLHNVYDDSRWNFSKTSIAIIESFFYSIGTLSDFSKDMKVLKTRRSEANVSEDKNHNLRYVIIGLLISVPLVAIILLLLSQADMIFNDILTKYFRFKINFTDTFGVIVTFALLFFGSYSVLRFFSKKELKEEVNVNRNLEPVIAITILSVISVIYLVFSVIQIVYLFMGGMNLPEKYTYAEYAREGFFQLLAVSIINFLMVLFINNHFKESIALKILMTIISACTYIMIASSCMRMLLYIDAYLLTFLRILVLWALAVLALLFAAVVVSIYKHDFNLFKYSIIVVSVLYLLLSFAHPDYIIADYNLAHINGKPQHTNAGCDYDYLENLSTDAAPVIAEYNDEWADRYFSNNKYFYEGKSIRQLNLSSYTAEILSKNR